MRDAATVGAALGGRPMVGDVILGRPRRAAPTVTETEINSCAGNHV
jgi:hypothetical protein